MKTLSEIAKELQLPESTVRNYASQFPDFLPRKKIDGTRWEKYDNQAVDVLRRISELKLKGLSRGEIASTLSTEFQPVIDGETETNEAEKTLQQPQSNQSTTTLTTTSLNQQNAIMAHYQMTAHHALESLEYKEKLLIEKRNQLTELEERLQHAENTLTAKERRIAELEKELQKVRKVRGVFGFLIRDNKDDE